MIVCLLDKSIWDGMAKKMVKKNMQDIEMVIRA